MGWRVERSEDTDRDLEAIFDFLFEVAIGVGDAPEEAFVRASRRIAAIEQAMLGLGRAPLQGTSHPDLLPGLRHVTKDRAIFYFEVDERARRVRVLAIFHGGQDHQRSMLVRLLRGGHQGS